MVIYSTCIRCQWIELVLQIYHVLYVQREASCLLVGHMMVEEFHPPNYFYPSFLDRLGCTSRQDVPKQGTSSSKLLLFSLTDNLRLEAKKSLLKKKKGGGETSSFQSK